MSFFYTAFGLIISSDIPLPELIAADPTSEADVCIRLGSTPRTLEDTSVRGVLYQAKSGEFLLNLERIARYQVFGGKEITISPANQHSESELRLFLYTSPFAALLQQRGDLVIHASAITDNNRAILFAGPSASGKSTLAAGFRQRGFFVLCDELAAIRQYPAGELFLQPAFPGLQLWPLSIQALGLGTPNLAPVRDGIPKRRFDDKAGFSHEAVRAGLIIILKRGAVMDPQFRELIGQEKFGALLRTTYLHRLVEGSGMSRAHFLLAMNAAEKTPVIELRFSELGTSIVELIDLIERDLFKWVR
jgi:hypothetical protein